MVAAILAASAILGYVAYAFKNIRFGVAAVVALLHDLLVVLGSFSLFGHFFGVEVDTLFVTAFLTTMSFSVHDTIVVFDRIREYTKRDRSRSFEEISDIAVTETMNRSLTNSFTIIFMLVALVLMGGDTTKWFVVALLIGTVSGTYSSPFVATPVLLLWHKLEAKRLAHR
jgi:preprotein translocase subunit SecF